MAVAYINCRGDQVSRGSVGDVPPVPVGRAAPTCLLTEHIAGQDNVEADYISCHLLDPGEWELAPWAFTHRVDQWGMAGVDFMAVVVNAKVLIFFRHHKEISSRGGGHAGPAMAP